MSEVHKGTAQVVAICLAELERIAREGDVPYLADQLAAVLANALAIADDHPRHRRQLKDCLN